MKELSKLCSARVRTAETANLTLKTSDSTVRVVPVSIAQSALIETGFTRRKIQRIKKDQYVDAKHVERSSKRLSQIYKKRWRPETT